MCLVLLYIVMSPLFLVYSVDKKGFHLYFSVHVHGSFVLVGSDRTSFRTVTSNGPIVRPQNDI
jgi:hypothetical protein